MTDTPFKNTPFSEASSAWTTLLSSELTKPYGVAELHVACFLPDDFTEGRTTVALLIPEGRMQCVSFMPDGTPLTMLKQLPQNEKVKHWLRTVCEFVAGHKACLIISCDTAVQTKHAAKIATRLLPAHERVPLERMYDPATRCRSGLN